jgi:hypothetical protein
VPASDYAPMVATNATADELDAIIVIKASFARSLSLSHKNRLSDLP